MLNCHGLFRAEEVWFLADSENFKSRRLECGFCPHCNNWIVGIFEKDKFSGKLFYSRYRDKKARKIYKEMQAQIDYKKSDIPCGSKSNMGFVYGKNEIMILDGQKYIVQKSVDFNGSEKVVKCTNAENKKNIVS